MNTIILTGANRGLGHALHELLAHENLSGRCIFISRKPLADEREGFQYVQADLGQDDLHLIVPDLAPDSKVVVLISNAGTIEPIGKAIDVTTSDMEVALRVNCLAPLIIAQQLVAEAGKMGARLFILNVSSGAARHPMKGWMAYCVSKAAALMALDVLAAENEHVDVMHFDPGVMDTDMQRYIRQQPTGIMPDVDLFREFKMDHALKSPREVAEQILAIVQDAVR